MNVVTVMTVMAKTAPRSPARLTAFTTVPVKPETLRRLRSYKVGGKTYDDVLNEFMDETPTAAFWKETERQMREEPRLTWDKAKRKFV
jgi:hypothetical protein